MKPEVVYTKAAPTTGFSAGMESRVTLDNVARVLEAAGTSLQHVVKVGVFLRDMKDFDAWIPR